MKFERLKALKRGKGYVHYKGRLCEIISINKLKKTAQVVEDGQMFAIPCEVKVEELE